MGQPLPMLRLIPAPMGQCCPGGGSCALDDGPVALPMLGVPQRLAAGQ